MVFQQLSKTGEVRAFPVVMKNIVLTEGFTGWYRGITASLARELIYSSLRLGLYEPFREQFESRVNKESDIQRIASRMAAGATAAGLAATIAHPTDLFKVRAQGYQGKPPPLYKLIKQVGGTPIKWGNYYEGIGTSVVRAMSRLIFGKMTDLNIPWNIF